ncbi:MAG: hypothetical protein ACO3JF_03680 [Ilumatobacteraceae bacterium]
MNEEIRDQLPDDLNAVDHIGVYDFPDNSRRRIPAVIYAVLAVVCVVIWQVGDADSSPLVNRGLIFAASVLGFMGLVSFTSGWRMTVDESEALVIATRKVGYAVGHASAQQVWRGLRSRPTWRIFCYSAEEPPLQRGLVLVDAVNGNIVECLVEKNPDAEVTPSSPVGE